MKTKAPTLVFTLCLAGMAFPLWAAAPAAKTLDTEDPVQHEARKLTPDRPRDKRQEIVIPATPSNPPPAFGTEPRSRPFGSGAKP